MRGWYEGHYCDCCGEYALCERVAGMWMCAECIARESENVKQAEGAR